MPVVYEIVDDVYHTYGEDPEATKAGLGVAKVQIKAAPPTQRGQIADPNEEPLFLDFFNGRAVFDEHNPEHTETIRLLNEAVERSARKGYPPGSVRIVGSEEMKVTVSQSELDELKAEIERLKRGQPNYSPKEVRVTLTPEEKAAEVVARGGFACRVCHKAMKQNSNRYSLVRHCEWIVKSGKASSQPKEHAVYLAELLRETAAVG